MISQAGLEVSVSAGSKPEANAELLVKSLRRLNALNALLSKVGITARGSRPAELMLTEADHPKLALKALQLEYKNQLSRVQDAEHLDFTPSTRLLTELADLVAALHERLGIPTKDDGDE
jgi:hypothetical protein